MGPLPGTLSFSFSILTPLAAPGLLSVLSTDDGGPFMTTALITVSSLLYTAIYSPIYNPRPGNISRSQQMNDHLEVVF